MLHCEEKTEIARMARAQLGLLLVLGAQDIADTVQQFQVALLWVRRQSCDKGKGHGSSHSKALLVCIGGGLGILASTEHDTVGRAGLVVQRLVTLVPRRQQLLAQITQSTKHTARITLQIRHTGDQNSLTNIRHHVGLLQVARGTVDVRKIEG